ncbi:alkaline phytoceramidase [Acaromyces ingoldii]|uniref:Alkaline phytoceramidase n=1 Tax=Acaromyces ingoldii TaxID=215250 RepID=A0A316YWL7_9BASI|nr:alkaline phytoceramidase [Acaromyces ingoldii]PWN93659.1 alkaline phytoceramidase [Acaromyces ingoldii]
MTSIDRRTVPSGYWGEVTSSLIWCEEKYQWSKYVAEPVNTFTNVFFFLLAIYGAKKTFDERLPLRFFLVNLGIAGIGVGSFLFHATLKYEAQLLDELPMIYTSALLTYCVLETTPGYGKPRFRILLPTVLILAVTFITVGYLYLGNPIFHQAAYATIQLVSTLRNLDLLYSSRSPLLASPAGRATRDQIQRTLGVGSVLFLGAFGIWNIDNIYCAHLRDIRKKHGFPLSLLTQGHGWWHIGTGMGAYLILVASELLVLSIKESPENFELVNAWPSLHFFVPHVKRIRQFDAKRDLKGRKPRKSLTAPSNGQVRKDD